MNDPLLQTFERLAKVEPDRARAERVRARGHGAMVKRRADRQPVPQSVRTAAWEPALAAAFCVGI